MPGSGKNGAHLVGKWPREYSADTHRWVAWVLEAGELKRLHSDDISWEALPNTIQTVIVKNKITCAFDRMSNVDEYPNPFGGPTSKFGLQLGATNSAEWFAIKKTMREEERVI